MPNQSAQESVLSMHRQLQDIHKSPFITLCLGYIELNHVIHEPHYNRVSVGYTD